MQALKCGRGARISIPHDAQFAQLTNTLVLRECVFQEPANLFLSTYASHLHVGSIQLAQKGSEEPGIVYSPLPAANLPFPHS